ncbi:hypothetical protein LCGC14_1333240 [marine sediment metagenome]|uniref:Uncharacterized protein n=1 Tax=marine sediment metagenome TaxID=412755 RepID=A0A0F9MWS6_9ZZZZ
MKSKMFRLSLAVAFVAALLFIPTTFGCHRCKSGTMRCLGTQVQLCAPNHKWKTVVDCNKLHRTKKQFRCVKLPNDRCSCRAKKETEHGQ